jgi:hypothetical protein
MEVFAALFVLVLPVSAAEAQAGADRYVVVLKDSVRDPAAVAGEHARQHGAEVSFEYRSALKG